MPPLSASYRCRSQAPSAYACAVPAALSSPSPRCHDEASLADEAEASVSVGVRSPCRHVYKTWHKRFLAKNKIDKSLS